MSLTLDNITFRYGKKDPVIRHLRTELPSEKITALTGPNGSGKTTLARIIMGILPQESGQIFWKGQCLDPLTIAQRGRRIGYVMQNPARQLFTETVEKEIELGLIQLDLPPREREARREEYLHYFGLEPYRDRFPQSLSGGEKQRLVLAAILAMDPEYLILDEPTSALDLGSRKRLGERLQELPCGMMIITHDQDFVKKYCPHIIEMEQINGYR